MGTHVELSAGDAFTWGCVGGFGAFALSVAVPEIILALNRPEGALQPKPAVTGIRRAALFIGLFLGMLAVSGVMGIIVGPTEAKFAVAAGAGGEGFIAGVASRFAAQKAG